MGYFFHQRRPLFVGSCILGVIAISEVLLIFWYEWYLDELLTEEFNKKRWDLPSRIYSDLEVLQPGDNIYQRDLKGKLQRLGYREISPI
ncbi:MAG TPA: hypothetical protein VNM22_00085, partial [Candidatus Limnocylindrales bacterium]|nr:hypothetical protein [Candidatus Limnocylindrales bacterium]